MTTPKTPEGWHPTNVFQAFMTAAQEIIDHNHRELVSDWLTRAWHHKVLPALAPTAPAGGEAPVAWIHADHIKGGKVTGMVCLLDFEFDGAIPLYTHPLPDQEAAYRSVGKVNCHISAELDLAIGTELFTRSDFSDAPDQEAMRGALEALDHIARRLQMDIDDGSRPDQWSMEDLVRKARAAIASLEAAISRKGKTE